MMISDLSVRRPVFATVMSLLLFILGVGAVTRLSLREFPDVDRPVVNIETRYRGASSDVVESRITQIIENEISGIEGVERLNSSSRDERSQINVEFTLERDLDSAANDVRERLSRVAARLPLEADPPQITKVDAGTDPIICLQRREHAAKHARAHRFHGALPRRPVLDARRRGQRAHERRASLRDARVAVAREPRGAPAHRRRTSRIRCCARTWSCPPAASNPREREFTLRTDTNLRTEEDFRNLVVGRGPDGYLVRLGEVAEVRLASDDDRSLSRSNGIIGLSMADHSAVEGQRARHLRRGEERLAKIQHTLPKDITVEVNIDNGVFIAASLKNVVFALSETLILVLIVIFLFLGTLRATLIPAVTIPVSIVAAAIVMLVLDYSINTLTLLAAVLAIGLVVDDAIVVLENIVRRIEAGEPPVLASINGSREIGFAVIATTLVLMAVFVPVSFMTGDTGRLFGEFGVTVAAAVGFSAFVALSLTPMMTSKLFANGMPKSRMVGGIDRVFHDLDDRYAAGLRRALDGRSAVVDRRWCARRCSACCCCCSWWAFRSPGLRLPSELAPQEDRAFVRIFVTAPEGSSIQYLDRQLRQVEAIAMDEVEKRQCAPRQRAHAAVSAATPKSNTGIVILPLESLGRARRERGRHRRSHSRDDAGHLRRARQREPGGQPAHAQQHAAAGHRAWAAATTRRS